MKIYMTIEVECGDDLIRDDKQEISWLLKDILIPKDLFIHSNEIGDTIGEVTEVKDVQLKF